MKRYLDIHSHTGSSDPDTWTLCNLYNDFQRSNTIPACSIGLHPWYLDRISEQMDELHAMASHPHVLAIGECGLDKSCPTPWEMQTDAFAQQIELANQVAKPLIIHCVRAYSEAITMLKPARTPVIFHGFLKNPELAQELTGHGFYLSFGAALTQDKKNAIDSLSLIPADRFFLETDDSDLPIQQIYKAAAAIRHMTEDALAEQLHQNYQTVFKT